MNQLAPVAPHAPAFKTLSFDAETKCTQISLEDLDRTIKLEDASGKLPKVTPVEHVGVLRTILNMAEGIAGLTPKSQLITIREPNCRRIRWNGDKGTCPIENYLVERLVTKIEFEDVYFEDRADAAGRMAVAVSYTDRGGIQVAFGHNVFACQNMNIFGEFMWATTGQDKYKMDYNKGMQLLYGWLQNYEKVKQITHQKIQTLMDTPVDEPMRTRLIGSLFEKAVRSNAGDKDVDAPLNQADCAALVRAGYDKIVESGRVITAWDLTNWATEVLKPERSDMAGMLISNHKVNEFIYNELCV